MEKPRNAPEEHRQKLWEILERDYSGSLMNNTKWMEALEGLKPYFLRYRAKLITEEQPSRWGSLQSGPEAHLPVGYVEGCVGSPIRVLEIEWLELSTFSSYYSGQSYPGKAVDRHAEIEQHLQSVGVPYTREGSVIRILGHVRRSEPTGRC